MWQRTTSRRSRLVVVAAAVVVTAVIVVTAVAVASGLAWWPLHQTTEGGGSPGLGTRTAQAGEVEVRMTALTLDRTGAAFEITLDTHTVPLDLDPAGSAQLRVNDSPAGGASWDGQGPGGHHREGTLRFATPIPAGASVQLRIIGLPQDATASWTAP